MRTRRKAKSFLAGARTPKEEVTSEAMEWERHGGQWVAGSGFVIVIPFGKRRGQRERAEGDVLYFLKMSSKI